MSKRTEQEELRERFANSELTEEIVEEWLTFISSVSGDDEVAHIEEDELWERVLRWIADHTTDPKAARLAKLATETTNIKFSRWCA